MKNAWDFLKSLTLMCTVMGLLLALWVCIADGNFVGAVLAVALDIILIQILYIRDALDELKKPKTSTVLRIRDFNTSSSREATNA